MASTDPFLGLLYGWAFGESGWDTGADANWQRIGATVQIGVKSKAMDIVDIVTPSPLDRYIVPSGATGVFAGKTNQIAYYRNSTWYFIIPQDGWNAYVHDVDQMVVYKSTPATWVAFGAPVTGAGFSDDPNDGGYYVRKLNAWVDGRSLVPIINTQAGTTYTAVANDRNAILRMTSSSPNTVTIPLNSAVSYPIGTQITVTQAGTGITSIVGAGGVTINAPEALTMYRRYGYIRLMKVGTDTWDLVETDGGAGGNGGNPTTSIGYSSTLTIDWRVNNKFFVPLNGNTTIDFTGGFDGQQINLRVKQDAAGGRTISWGSHIRFGTDLTGISLSTSPNKIDYMGFIYCAADDKYDAVALIRGF